MAATPAFTSRRSVVRRRSPRRSLTVSSIRRYSLRLIQPIGHPPAGFDATRRPTSSALPGRSNRLQGRDRTVPTRPSPEIFRASCPIARDSSRASGPTYGRSRMCWCVVTIPSDHDQPLPHADGDRLGSASGIELREDRGDVKLDGVLRDAEPRGDDLVAEPLGDHAEYLDLAGREGLTGDRGAASLPRGGHWPEYPDGIGVSHDEPGGGCLDRGDDFLSACAARQHGPHSCPERLGTEGALPSLGEENDGGRQWLRSEVTKPRGGVLGAEIDEQHVGLGGLDLLGEREIGRVHDQV